MRIPLAVMVKQSTTQLLSLQLRGFILRLFFIGQLLNTGMIHDLDFCRCSYATGYRLAAVAATSTYMLAALSLALVCKPNITIFWY